MKLDDFMVMSWRMVGRHWRRYRTVMIAIGLGTIGFILIRTLADSVQERVESNLELIGQVSIVHASWQDRRSPWHLGEYLEQDAERLRKIPNALVVAPIRYTDRSLKALGEDGREEVRELQITGIDKNYWETISPQLSKGRLIDDSDAAKRLPVCVLHKRLAPEIFGDHDPLGKTISFGSYSYKVVGLLGGPADQDILRAIFVPLGLAARHLGQMRQFTQVRMRVDSPENVEAVSRQAKAVLQRAHPGYEDAVSIRYHSTRLKRVNLIMSLITMFGYTALATVFVLGKVGLTNVMLSAIQERTREIGLRKALGATDSAIRAQFVCESVLVSFVAACLGAFLGVMVSIVVKEWLNLDMSHDVLVVSILADLCITTLIGLAAGSYPSLIASRLDIVTAMRFD